MILMTDYISNILGRDITLTKSICRWVEWAKTILGMKN